MTNLNGFDRVAIGFVLFNPSESFRKRILSLSDLGIDIYIFDNSPNPILKFDGISSNIHVISDCGNLGLGKGLNSLGKHAYKNEKEGLLYFDQDTLFDQDSLFFINDYLFRHIDQFRDLASIFFTSKPNKKVKHFVSLIHHSGMLFNLKNLKKIGWHNKNFFLDILDYDYCLEVRREKLKILQINNTPGIDHQSDQDANLIPIFGKKFSLSRVYAFNRVADTIKKTLYLIVKSFFILDIYFSLNLFRFLIIYIFFQLYARIYSYIKNTSNMIKRS
tara:strand:+ start:11446 stop:12270 length:825 start_codon:yes stop_codon:yes gene_type:complete